MKVCDFIVERLLEWQFERCYGYPSETVLPLLASIESSPIELITTRHQEMAAFAACAHAKFTGTPGLVVAGGAGAVQLLNGLYDAKLDNQPVVALLGQQQRACLGSNYQQELDLVSLFKDVAGAYVQEARVSAQVRHLLDRAVRIAIAEKTVTCVIVPKDLFNEAAIPEPKREHGRTFSGIGYRAPLVIPQPADLEQAAQILNRGTKVAMLVGAGALHASEEIRTVAELLGAGVAKSLLGKAALTDDLPYVTGAIGLLGTAPSWHLMQNCDTLLMVGSNFPYAEFLPPEGDASGVQIDTNPRNLSLRYPMSVNLMGDSKLTLRNLIPLLERKEDRSWQQQIEMQVKHWWGGLEDRAKSKVSRINPQRLFWELSQLLPADSILCCDAGTSVVWFARDLKVRPGMMASVSGGLASMGCALPYAIAAKFAFPGRPVFAFVGDGAMQMSGNNELLTIAKYYEQWRDPRLTVLVMNNQELNFSSWEMRVMEGEPKQKSLMEIPPFNYAAHARAIGLSGIRIESDEQIAEAWKTASLLDRPVVLEALTDPTVPPLPPSITPEQAAAMASCIMKGDPDSIKVITSSLGQLIGSFPSIHT